MNYFLQLRCNRMSNELPYNRVVIENYEQYIEN